jgi:hypothetical protein
MWSLGFESEALQLEQSIPALRASDGDAHQSVGGLSSALLGNLMI